MGEQGPGTGSGRVEGGETPETPAASKPTIRPLSDPLTQRRRDRRDLAIAIVVPILFYCVAAATDLYEGLQALFARTEQYELDELFLMLPVLSLMLAWLAWRRWRDMRESEARYRDIAECTSDWVYATDADLRYTFVTGRFTDVTGFTERDWLGKPIGTFADPAYVPEMIARAHDAIAQREPVKDLVAQIRGADGSPHWVNINAKPIFDDNGKFLGYRGATRDITELKRIEATLMESRERERLILESAAEGIIGVDRDGRCTFANASALRLLCYSSHRQLVRTEIRKVFDTLPAASGPQDPIQRACTLGLSTPMTEATFRRADRSTLPVEFRCSPMVHDGEIRGAVVSFIDTVTRKAAEEARLRAEQRLADAIASMDHAFVLWDADDRLVLCNDRYREFNSAIADHIVPGIRFEDLARASVAAGQCPLDEPPEDWIQRRLRAHQSCATTLEQELTDGRWLRISESPTADGGRVGIRVDITEVKRTEEALRQSEQRLNLAIEATRGGMWDVDMKSRHRWWSPAYKRLLGYDSDSPTPSFEQFVEMVHPDDRDRVHKRRERAVTGTDPDYLETFRCRRRDGSYIWLESYGRLIRDSSGAAARFVGFNIDATPHKERERELMEAQGRIQRQADTLARLAEDLHLAKAKAEEASRAKSNFLAMMSHELRTPLTGILSVAEILLRDRITPPQRQSMEMLRQSGRTLLTLLNDILDFSKIEAGEVQLEQTDFDLLDLLDSVQWLFRSHAAEKGLTLDLQLPEDFCRWLHGDATRLRCVVGNLLSNAVKFTARGQVRLTVESTHRSQGHVQLRFEVADTGIGIPEETLPRLFQPFVQADPSTARQYGGTGLGLAISKRLVTAMGGEMGVASTFGEGSTFWFTVTMRPASAVPVPSLASARPESAEPGPTVSILLVEDNALNRELLAQILESAGHRVSMAPDGGAAIEMMQKGKFDVVFMDMHMPGMDGFAATRALRALPGDKGGVPIVALTADAMPAMRKRAMDAGFDDFLTKPVGLDDLAACLRRVMPASPPGPAEGPPLPPPASEAATPEALSPPVPEAATPLLDEGRLLTLNRDVGGDKLNKMLNRLCARLPSDIQAVVAAHGAGDFETLAATAHTVKGSVGLFGCARLMNAAADVQKAAEERRTAAELITALEAIARDTGEALKRLQVPEKQAS